MPSTRSVVVAMWALFGAARATLCSSSFEGTLMYEGAIARSGVRLAQTNAGGGWPYRGESGWFLSISRYRSAVGIP